MREPGGPPSGARRPREASPRPERPPSRPDALSGLVLEGRYRIGARLARGGMSTVYRGVDLRLDRPVAIKVMSPQYAADPTFLTRFEREARAAARLDNPRVVGVYDQGRDGDIVFLVMELVDGGTLRDLLHQRGELSVPVALSVLEPVLDALAAAHAAGLVHRDVKPENVLISARGEVKVADFGLVRAVTSTTMATGNVILGTVAYLSPEQVATGAADERSDVYSAGIVAYEMLTGHPPFGGDNALSVAYQHVHSEVPPVADEAPGVPVDIAAAVDAATNRDPLARPVNAAEFLRRLRTARRDLGLALVPVPVPRPPRRRVEPGLTASNRTAPERADADRAAGPAGGSVAGPATSDRHAGGDAAGAGADHPGHPATHGSPEHISGGPSAAARHGSTAGIPDADSASGSVTGLPTRLTGPGLQAAGQHTQVAGRGTAPAGRPDRLTIAAPPGDRAPRRRRGRSGPRGSTGGDGTRAHHTDRLPRAGSRRWRVRVIVLVVVLLVAGAAAFGGWWLGGRWTSAPTVLGAAQDAAVAQVRDAGLVPSLTTAHDNAVPSGKVVSADPTGGARQLRGAAVTLVISSGRPVVPRIGAGTTVAAATELVAAADLTADTDPARDVYSDTVPAGAVVRTDPASGQPANIGSTVMLIRSRGPVPVLVPTVAGKQVEDARNKLLVNGLAVGPPEQTFDPDQPAGTVLGTNPPAGSTVPHGSPVSLVVAASKTVPDVSGTPVEQAARQLRDDGFHVTVGDAVFDATVPGGEVVRSDPPLGTRLDPADPAVTLIASNAVTVPPVTGTSVATARSTLEEMGLQVQVFAFFGADGSTVTKQQPDSGELVEPGSTVQLTAWP